MPNPGVFHDFIASGVEHSFKDVQNNTHAPQPATDFEMMRNESNLGPLGFALLTLSPFITGLIGGVVSYIVDYMLSHLFFALAIIESDASARVQFKEHLMRDDPNEKVKHASTDFITSSIRSTLRHLQLQAGDLSAIRGLGTWLVIRILVMVLGVPLEWVIGRCVRLLHVPSANFFILQVAGNILLSQFMAAWVHVVISKPSLNFFFRRLPLSWLGVVRATSVGWICYWLLSELMKWLPARLPSMTKSYTIFDRGGKIIVNDASGPSVGTLFVLWRVFLFLLSFGIDPILEVIFLIPVKVTLIRIFASLLPVDDETIIPMDRSFGRRPNSGILYQARPLTTQEAFKTIDRPTHWRLAKLYLKFFAIKKAISSLFWALFLAEVGALAGYRALWLLTKLCMVVPISKEDLAGVSTTAMSWLEPMLANGTIATVVSNATVVPSAVP